MWDRDELVFIEVKMRSSNDYGHPEEMISWQKARRLQKTARSYIHRHRMYRYFWRFDIVAITAGVKETETLHLEDVFRQD